VGRNQPHPLTVRLPAKVLADMDRIIARHVLTARGTPLNRNAYVVRAVVRDQQHTARSNRTRRRRKRTGGVMRGFGEGI
jgi:hypothetical protein